MTDSEKEVAAYLRELNVWWKYEYPIFVYDEKDRPRVWTPDFYLPELGVFIEVCGSKNFNYNYRSEIYNKNRVPIIFIHQFKRDDDWRKYLRKRLDEIHNKRWEIIKNV